MTPLCMTPDELAAWEDANSVLSSPAPSPCQDCPLAFAAQMRAEGCCNGEPGRALRYPADDKRRADWRERSRRRYARQKALRAAA